MPYDITDAKEDINILATKIDMIVAILEKNKLIKEEEKK